MTRVRRQLIGALWRMAGTATVFLLVTSGSLHGQTSEGVREFTLSPKTVQTVHGKLGFTSVIVLPPDDPIAETVIGDTTGWFVEDSGNVIKVTMLKVGVESNVNVVMADNRIYTFLLREVGKGEKPDFQLIAKSDRATGETRARFIPLADHQAAVTALRGEVDSMKAAINQAQAAADQRVREQVADFTRQYPQRLRTYETGALRVAPFFVQQVWGDDTSTWIRLKADELPAVYEVVDGHPSILNPIALPGEKPGLLTLRIPKSVTQGYLKVGKAEWKFAAADAEGTR